MRYEGFLTSGAVTIAPAVKYDTRNASIGAQGGWTVFESGNQIVQATAAAAWLSAPRERWRWELSGATGLSKYADATATAHVLARSRIHLSSEDRGVWLGAATGASVDEDARVPFEIGFGAWHVRDRFALVGTITSVWLASDHHVDIAGAAKWTASRIEFDALFGVRPIASSSGAVGEARTGVWGELAAMLPLSQRISLTLSGGSYRSDPVRRVLGATYATAGLQLALGESQDAAEAMIPPVARARANTATAARAQLHIEARGGQRLLRIDAPGAKSVEIIGDFTDWQPLALTAIGADRWQVQLQLAAGVYRLNVRIDGGAWFVPDGARSEEDEFGGVVGVVVIE